MAEMPMKTFSEWITGDFVAGIASGGAAAIAAILTAGRAEDIATIALTERPQGYVTAALRGGKFAQTNSSSPIKDLKTGKLVLDLPSREAEIYREIDEEQENAFYYDFHASQAVITKSLEEREQILKNRKKQKPSNQTLKDEYGGVSVTTTRQFNALWQKFRENEEDDNNELDSMLTRWLWLHVCMPREFNYTGTILLNSPFHGLLHAFLRHFNQWVDYIPNCKDALKKLSVLEAHLDYIRYAEGEDDYKWAISEYLEELRRLDNNTFIDVQQALNDIQLELHKFIQDNVTYENYLGDGIIDGKISQADRKVKDRKRNTHVRNILSEDDRHQVYFMVKDWQGELRVMVLGVSHMLNPPDKRFPDGRPIRKIIAVYFISWETYKKRFGHRLFPK